MAAKLLLLIPLYALLYTGFLATLTKKTGFKWSFYLKNFARGILGILPLLVLKYFNVIDKTELVLIAGAVYTYFVLALIEELQKEIAFHTGHTHHLSMHEKILTCIGIAGGFAFIENILFATHFYSLSGMLLIAGTRFVLNTTIHTTCMAIGILYMERLKNLFPHANIHALHFFSILPATLAHAFFNLLYVWHIGFITVPLAVSSIFILKWMYEKNVFDRNPLPTLSTA